MARSARMARTAERSAVVNKPRGPNVRTLELDGARDRPDCEPYPPPKLAQEAQRTSGASRCARCELVTHAVHTCTCSHDFIAHVVTPPVARCTEKAGSATSPLLPTPTSVIHTGSLAGMPSAVRPHSCTRALMHTPCTPCRAEKSERKEPDTLSQRYIQLSHTHIHLSHTHRHSCTVEQFYRLPTNSQRASRSFV